MIPELRMRERELKKEWIDAARETKQRQRAQRQSELSEVRRNVRRGVLAFEWNWAEVGLVLSQTVRSAFFFFFFEFRPESADTTDSGPSQLDSGRIGPSRSCVGVSWRKPRGIHAARRGGMRPDARAAASPTRRLIPLRRMRLRHPWCRVRAS